MIQPKFFKIIDLSVQVLALILSLLYYLFTRDSYHSDTFPQLITGYYIVGTCQVLSCLVNMAIFPNEYKANLRKWYNLALLLIAIMTIITLVMNSLMLMLIILLYISPILACVYLGITIAELYTVFKMSKEHA